MAQTLMEIATGFAVAQIHVGPCPVDVIDQILQTTHATLLALSHREATPSETLASLRQRSWATLQRTQVICLECGQAYRLLSSRHLALHELTARAYKKKWGIPLGQPLSAGSLTQHRRQRAKERGAGQYLATWRAEQHL